MESTSLAKSKYQLALGLLGQKWFSTRNGMLGQMGSDGSGMAGCQLSMTTEAM